VDSTINFDAIPLFSHLGRIDRARLLPHFAYVRFRTGDVLVRQGEPGDSLYVIIEGEAKVVITAEQKDPLTLATLRTGECFGEIALLTGEPRSADVIATTAVVTMRLSRSRFTWLMERHHSLALQVARILAERIGATNKAIQGVLATSPEAEPRPDGDEILRSSGELAAGWGLHTPIRDRRIMGLTLAAAVCVTAWFILALLGLTPAQVVLLELLLAATVFWSFDAFSFHAVALALPLGAVVCGVARPETAFSGFSSPSWLLTLGVFAIAAAVSRSGLIYRLVLLVIRYFPPGYRWQSFALAFAGLLLTPVIPSSNGRTVLAAPMAASLAEIHRFRRGSAGAVGLSLATLLGFGHMSFLFMNGSAICLMALGLLPGEISGRITWSGWFMAALPLGLVFFALSFVAILAGYHPQKRRRRKENVVLAQLAVLGKMGGGEKITLATMAAVLAAFITQPLHQVNGAWVALSGFLVLLGSGVLTEKSVRNDIDWGFLVYFGSLIGFAAIIGDSGIGSILTARSASLQQLLSWSPGLILVSISLGMHLLRFALPLSVAQLICILAITPVIGMAGINPFVGCLVVLISGNPWFLAYQDSNFISLSEATEGKLLSHRQTLPAAWFHVAAVQIAILAAVPWWRHLGFISG
jgi:branched-chain amino acid transport system substrate-binding protein